MNLPPDIMNLAIGLGILVGVIQCFYGYRFFRFILGLIGFVLGALLAGGIVHANTQEQAIALVAGLVGGFIGVVLMMGLYLIGIFLVGAFLGGVVGTVFFAAAESSPEPVVLLILAVIGGVMALIFQKIMIVVSTAFGGAWNVVAGIAYFATGAIDPIHIGRLFRPGESDHNLIILAWLALGIVGAIFQYRAAPGTTKEKETRLWVQSEGRERRACQNG